MLSQTQNIQCIRPNIPIKKNKKKKQTHTAAFYPKGSVTTKVPAFRTTQLLLWEEGWTGGTWGRGRKEEDEGQRGEEKEERRRKEGRGKDSEKVSEEGEQTEKVEKRKNGEEKRERLGGGEESAFVSYVCMPTLIQLACHR